MVPKYILAPSPTHTTPEADTPHNLIKTHHTPHPNFIANFEEDCNISPIPQTTPTTTFIRTDTDTKTDGPRNKLENNPRQHDHTDMKMFRIEVLL